MRKCVPDSSSSSLRNIIFADRDAQQSINRNGWINTGEIILVSSRPRSVWPSYGSMDEFIKSSDGGMMRLKKCYRCYGRVKLLLLLSWDGHQKQNGTRVISRNSTTHFHPSILTRRLLGCYLSEKHKHTLGISEVKKNRWCTGIAAYSSNCDPIARSNGLNFHLDQC